jgi:xanthine/CO dehydrogenase XdhC/CoxF family maturation factor
MDSFDVLEEAGELTRRGQPFALATVVWRQAPSSGQQGSRAIITASGDLHGWIGGACAEPVVIREAQQVITEGVPRLLLLGTRDQFGAAVPDGMTVVPIACQSEGALEVYIEPVLPAPHLVIVGRSPMVETLADLSRALGWRTTVVDRGGAGLPRGTGRAAGPAGPGPGAGRAGPGPDHAPRDRGRDPGRAGPAARFGQCPYGRRCGSAVWRGEARRRRALAEPGNRGGVRGVAPPG